MNSYLIIGGNPKERLKKTKELIRDCGLKITDYENHPDILLLEPNPSISINQVRQLQKFLSRKPYQSTTKVTVISQAEKLTLPAQNAFLKTLEEPPAHSIIILGSQSKENLLPTITSRCQIIQLPTKIDKIDKSLITHYSLLITKLLNSRVGERLKLIEPYTKNREEAINFCEEMILVLREILINKNNQQSIIAIKSLQQTLNLLNSNVNVKLCLDNFVLALPPAKKRNK